ncbi:MAG: diacylglycerol kinase, partial [Pseudorhizobium sp.]
MERAPQESVIKKASGPRRLLAATRYSIQGMRRCWQEEAFRTEVVGFLLGLVLFAVIGAEPADYLVFVVLMLVLFAVEALNTAIEVLVNHISPGWSEAARQAKDLGSLAVALMILANLAYIGGITLQA